MNNTIHSVAEEPQEDQQSKMSEPLASPDWKEQFMACLTVPVFAEMRQQEAIALREANRPSSLYRYRPLNKDVLDRELENIEQQQVWLSPPLNANDAFDSSFNFKHEEFVLPKDAADQVMRQFPKIAGDKLEPGEIAELSSFPALAAMSKERFIFLARKAELDQPEGHADFLFEFLQHLFKSFKTQHVRQLNEFIKQNLSVCCFCERCDQNLMWAHYADQHRGCCIEFDVSRLFRDGVGPLLPVIYRDGLFDVTTYYSAISSGGGNVWSAMLAACHKSKDWAYELEWRIIFPAALQKESANWHIPIKSITMGLRVQTDVECRLFSIAQRLGVPLYRTSQSYFDSSLNFELVTDHL